MTPAELRMVRESLGLTGEDLARHLGVALRTVRRWEHGQSPIPDGVQAELQTLESWTANHARMLADGLRESGETVLTIPEHDGEEPAAWWRAVAARVRREVPGVRVHYRS